MSDSRANQLKTGQPPAGAQLEPSTVRPPFDPEEFARESDSMIRIEAALPTAPPPPGMAEYAPGSVSGMHAVGAASGEIVPALAVAHDDLEWLDLAPEARALLAHVDGRETVAAICARAGVSADTAMTVLDELARDGWITLRR